MHNKFIFRLHKGLSRQGPGSPECTKKAFSYIKNLPEEPEILDIGSGTGAQADVLLEICRKCRITSVDIYRPFLDELEINAEKRGFSDRVQTVCASMDNLPFEEESFDLLWAEGSVFVMGFSAGLTYWKKFVKPGGYFAITDIVWFVDNPSKEAAAFWGKNYRKMRNIRQGMKDAEDAGFEVEATFRLSESAWLNYLKPLSENLNRLKEEFGGTPDADMLIKETKTEIEIFNKYNRDYGYLFYILKKKE